MDSPTARDWQARMTTYVLPHLADTPVDQVGTAALRRIDSGTSLAKLTVRLTVLTAARQAEIRRATPDQYDLDAGAIHQFLHPRHCLADTCAFRRYLCSSPSSSRASSPGRSAFPAIHSTSPSASRLRRVDRLPMLERYSTRRQRS